MCLRCEVLSWNVDMLLKRIALANENGHYAMMNSLEDDLSVQHVMLLESQRECKEVKG